MARTLMAMLAAMFGLRGKNTLPGEMPEKGKRIRYWTREGGIMQGWRCPKDRNRRGRKAHRHPDRVRFAFRLRMLRNDRLGIARCRFVLPAKPLKVVK